MRGLRGSSLRRDVRRRMAAAADMTVDRRQVSACPSTATPANSPAAAIATRSFALDHRGDEYAASVVERERSRRNDLDVESPTRQRDLRLVTRSLAEQSRRCLL